MIRAKDEIFEDFKQVVNQTLDLPRCDDAELLEDMMDYLNAVLRGVEIGHEALSSM